MSDHIVGGSNHTPEAFVDFAYDLLEYAIPKFEHPWIPPPDYKRGTKKVFQDDFGEVVITYRTRHEEKLDKQLAQHYIDSGEEELTEYLHQYCAQTLKGEIPLMELIAYFAFLLDLSLHCYDSDALDEMYALVNQTFDVFLDYVQQYFTIIGGWHALFRVGEQYGKYIEDIPDKMEISKL